MDLADNVLLTHHRAEGLSRRGWISPRAAADWAARVRDAFDVRASAPRPMARSLSGGNLQKFVIGREILRRPGVLVVNQPTWGVDAGAAALIRNALIALARDGAAVLVVSQDLDEIFQISDRIAVMWRGRLSPAWPAERMSPRRVGLLMGGAEPDAEPAAAARTRLPEPAA
jgi:simple sugar transport system ATP-binding protein